jgi:hypothetical protein
MRRRACRRSGPWADDRILDVRNLRGDLPESPAFRTPVACPPPWFHRGMGLADRLGMKPSARNLVLAGAVLRVVAGCGGVTLQPSDGGSSAGHGGGGNTSSAGSIGTAGGSGGSQAGGAGGAGQAGGAGGAAPICSGLDQSQCAATSGCTALACPTCSGQTVFSSCYRAVGAPPPSCIQPGCPAPESCTDLGEIACQARTDCEAFHCPDCKGGQTFVGCGVPGNGAAAVSARWPARVPAAAPRSIARTARVGRRSSAARLRAALRSPVPPSRAPSPHPAPTFPRRQHATCARTVIRCSSILVLVAATLSGAAPISPGVPTGARQRARARRFARS